MSYDAEIVKDLAGLEQHEFGVPGGQGRVELQVRVRPVTGEPWVGLFRTLGFSDVSGLFSWSDGPMMLVVASGYPHYVSTEQPSFRTELPIFPVRHALRHPTGRVILADFSRACAVDGESVLWVTPALGSDWLDDVRIEGNFLLGRGNVPETGQWAPFRTDITTGETETEFRET